MKYLITALLSPMAFALGFLWPLASQLLLGTQLLPSETSAWVVGALLTWPLGWVAQLRGSWLWIR